MCEVHGRPMPTRAVRVVYGLRRGLKQSPAYLAARRMQFPHCDDWANGGCMVRELRSRDKPICPECVTARNAYLQAEHPSWVASHQPDSI
jgi:hypothetical protein